MSQVLRYPLQWPQGWPRTRDVDRKRSNYKVSEERAKRHLVEELRRLGAREVVISTNIRLRNDGLPYCQQAKLQDPGVAVYWTRKGRPYAIACDRYVDIGANFRALGLTIDAIRAIDRAGAGEILERTFTGFAALPPPSDSPPPPSCWDVLEIPPTSTPAEVEAAFLRLAKKHHPDTGGTPAQFITLINARAEARAQLSTP